MNLKREQFLLAITTTHRSDWREKIKEIDELGLEKVAIFPTCLQKKQRQEMFDLLSKTKLKEIPFCHMRTDMDFDELDWLIKNYKTKIFNLHSEKEYKYFFDYSAYREMIYLENNSAFSEDELKRWAGICLDFSHLEDFRLVEKDRFVSLFEVIKKYPIGCNHISAISPEPHIDNKGHKVYSEHTFQDLSEFDYLKNYPKEWFSNYVAIEVANSLSDQLKAIDYIYEICC